MTAAHQVDLAVGGRPLVGLGSHDEEPDRGVPHVAAEVEGDTAALDGVEVLGKGLELVPGHPGHQGVEAHVLHVLEGADDDLDAVGPGGGDGEAAVAGHHRGHPVERGRAEVGVPEHLGVVVGVDVDESRGHHLTGGVQFGRPRQPVADGRDAAVADGDIGPPAGHSAPVDQRPAPYDDVTVHGHARFLGPGLHATQRVRRAAGPTVSPGDNE